METESGHDQKPGKAERADAPVQRMNPLLAVVAAAAAWGVPGLGHLLLRRWGKALVYFLAVGSLVVAGMLMRGDLFHSGGADAFETLGFIADSGSGVFYFLAPEIDAAGSDVSHAAGDYGTRMIAAAGVLNMLCVLEAFEIGLRGREPQGEPS
jgi:TM2 domain-containing membrane protein YozV